MRTCRFSSPRAKHRPEDSTAARRIARRASLGLVTDGYGLISIYQEAPGGTWGGWYGPGWENAPGLHVDPPPQSSLIRNERDVGGRVKPGHGACAIGGEYAE
jgi:hypothetical protein